MYSGMRRTRAAGSRSPAKLKPLYVLASDTRVEASCIAARIRKELETLLAAAEHDHLPLTSDLAFPKLNDTFWVKLIGCGIARRTRRLPGARYAAIMPTVSKV